MNSHDVSETRCPPRGTTDKKMKNFRRSAPAMLLCVYVEGHKVSLSNCLRFVMGRSLFAPSSSIPSRIFLAIGKSFKTQTRVWVCLQRMPHKVRHKKKNQSQPASKQLYYKKKNRNQPSSKQLYQKGERGALFTKRRRLSITRRMSWVCG